MSLIGVKSSAIASAAARNASMPSSAPTSAASAAAARFGVAAMPPKARRASVMRPSETEILKPPITAEISWSNRLEIL